MTGPSGERGKHIKRPIIRRTLTPSWTGPGVSRIYTRLVGHRQTNRTGRTENSEPEKRIWKTSLWTSGSDFHAQRCVKDQRKSNICPRANRSSWFWCDQRGLVGETECESSFGWIGGEVVGEEKSSRELGVLFLLALLDSFMVVP